MIIKGRAIKLGDNINTDFIISGRYKFAITDIKELAKHIMEDIDPDFSKKIVAGESIIVAGKNFGMGSSREQAPLVIKECGIKAVVAKSFARIFYRNGFNIGLPLIEADTENIAENDLLEFDLDKAGIPKIMQKLLEDGGLVAHYKKHNGLKLE